MYTVHVGVQSLTNIKEMKIASECIVELYTCKHAEIFKNTREVHEAQPSASRTSRAQLVKHFIITKKNTGIFV